MLPVVLLAGVLVLLAPPCAADTPAVRSVDVYPRGARFVFELAPTEDSFRFELPGAFDAASIRLLNLTGVSDLQVVEQGRKGWIPPSLAPLKERTDAQAKAISLMKAKVASLEQTRAMLNVSSAQIKTFIWVSVMQLSEEGKIDLNADIRNYLPKGFLKNLHYDTPH